MSKIERAVVTVVVLIFGILLPSFLIIGNHIGPTSRTYTKHYSQEAILDTDHPWLGIYLDFDLNSTLGFLAGEQIDIAIYDLHVALDPKKYPDTDRLKVTLDWNDEDQTTINVDENRSNHINQSGSLQLVQSTSTGLTMKWDQKFKTEVILDQKRYETVLSGMEKKSGSRNEMTYPVYSLTGDSWDTGPFHIQRTSEPFIRDSIQYSNQGVYHVHLEVATHADSSNSRAKTIWAGRIPMRVNIGPAHLRTQIDIAKTAMIAAFIFGSFAVIPIVERLWPLLALLRRRIRKSDS